MFCHPVSLSLCVAFVFGLRTNVRSFRLIVIVVFFKMLLVNVLLGNVAVGVWNLAWPVVGLQDG